MHPRSDAINFDRFFRCVEVPDGWVFQVDTIHWASQIPVPQWKTFRRWKTPPNAARLMRAKSAALRDTRFFRVCRFCQELCNAGQLHGDICHGCAEHYLGIIH